MENRNTRGAARTRRSITPLLWMLLLILFLVLGGLVGVITLQPERIGLARVGDLALTDASYNARANQTAAALQATATVLVITAERGTQRELELLATQAALVNFAERIGQTETQQLVNIRTTQTAETVRGAQEATQVAVNFASTQAALDAIGTQVQLDFRATQNALAQRSTPAASPVPSDALVLDRNFVSGTETAFLNALPLTQSWGISGNGSLLAQRDQAALRTARADYTTYVLTAQFIPNGEDEAQIYELLLGGALLRLSFDGQTLEGALFAQPDDLIFTIPQTALPADTLEIRAASAAQPGTVQVSVNGLLVADTALSIQAGYLGVRVPGGTELLRFSVE